MPKGGEGLRPFEPRVKGGDTPLLKIPPFYYFSGEGAAKNRWFFKVKLAFAIKLYLTFLEHFSHYLWRLQ